MKKQRISNPKCKCKHPIANFFNRCLGCGLPIRLVKVKSIISELENEKTNIIQG